MAWWMAAAAAIAAAQAGGTPMAAGPAGAAAPCPATPVALPPELAGWPHATALVAGASAARAPLLTIGVAVRAALQPSGKVAYARSPEKPSGAGSSGGVLAFAVPAAGRYRVALGSAAWIDVVRDGTAVVSVAHGHGPECSGIRKMVDFDLAPGRHLLQVSDNADAILPLMVARLR